VLLNLEKNVKIKEVKIKITMIIRYLIEKLGNDGLQKVWTVLQHIKDTLDLSEPSNSILVSLNPDDYTIKIPAVQIIAVLNDLQNKGILKILKTNELARGQNAKLVKIDREKFKSEYKQVENRRKKEGLEKIQEITTKSEGTAVNSIPKEKIRYWIDFKNRRIILNDKYLVSKLQFNRPHELFFEYLCSHLREKIKNEDIPPNLGLPRFNFNKVVNALGFKGELRKCFFDTSNTTIRFLKSITEEDLKERVVNIIKLEKQIKKLSNIQ